MPLLVLLLVLLQAYCIVNVIRSERDTTWIFILLLLPVLGTLLFLFFEILPELRATSLSVAKKDNREIYAESSLDPNLPDTVINSLDIAEQLYAVEKFSDAKSIYENLLVDFADNPDLLFGLAKCEFGLQNYTQSISMLDTAISKNPQYRNTYAHLLYARALHQIGNLDQAEEEFNALIKYAQDAEIKYYFALLLKDNNKPKEALELLQAIIQKAKTSSSYYTDNNQEWINLAKLAIQSNQ